VRTFTIGFPDEAFDEAPFARQVAAHLGTDHTELYVTGDDALAVVPRLPAMYDEPFADSSQIPTHLVSKLARAHVTVSLSGDGGDELFAGYERYVRGEKLAASLTRVPRALRHAAAATLRAAPPALVDRLASAVAPALPARLRVAHAGEKVRKLAAALDEHDPRNFYLALVSNWRDRVPVVGHGGAASSHERIAAADRDLPLAQWMMLADQLTYLPDDILVKVDRASMAVSLESRVPLLDHELVAYAWSIPLPLKLHGGRGKFLLRELLCRHVPRELVERPKRGFAVPLAAWLRGPLRDWAEALLDEARLRHEGFLDPAPVAACWRAHLAGRAHLQDDLWNVLSFQAWLESLRT
jgi:asparagine synthase (glutamine-hydrolysing)